MFFQRIATLRPLHFTLISCMSIFQYLTILWCCCRVNRLQRNGKSFMHRNYFMKTYSFLLATLFLILIVFSPEQEGTGSQVMPFDSRLNHLCFVYARLRLFLYYVVCLLKLPARYCFLGNLGLRLNSVCVCVSVQYMKPIYVNWSMHSSLGLKESKLNIVLR